MTKRLVLIVGASALLSACATTDAGTVAGDAPAVVGTAALVGADGSPRGTATLRTNGGALTLTVDATNLPPGEHGAHLHAVGRCDPPGFTSAGAHLNPSAKMHGTMNPQGSHMGDLPNLTVAADGRATLSASLNGDRATLEPQIFDADGTAIVIHATADDYKTDPSGNSGARIACGTLSKGG